MRKQKCPINKIPCANPTECETCEVKNEYNRKLDRDLTITNLENLEKNLRQDDPSGAFTIRQALRLLGRTPNLPI